MKLGSLHTTRDLNYVEDICRGFLALASCDEAVGKAVNVGSGREISIGDLAATIAKLMNRDIEIVTDDERIRPADSEVERLLCDNRLMQSLTGWSPAFTREEGLQKTIDWFQNDADLSIYKPDIYNI